MGTKETLKPHKKMAKSEADASKPSRHSGFDEKMSSKLPPGFKAPSMETDTISKEWMLNVCHLLCFRQPGEVDKFARVGPFLHAFLMKSFHRAKIFLSKQSILSLRNIMCFYGMAAAVAESGIVTDDNHE